ncbi:hypothetical protein KI809_10920 [Geobacter pelophilus]|uniref:Carboxypeptidase regulatory-like domain-containing protein n=1 Tax=Geoanaerobacter pelophilus TaxID=60036 RepID=A0AAW4L5I2_9BACT|nr:carboxypeptidase-like regulatory domain-containing protein [Geoanaerobacter pelophilus]MBT0664812.1 hypothetical protein [Geoanaerobacter pelophilus]
MKLSPLLVVFMLFLSLTVNSYGDSPVFAPDRQEFATITGKVLLEGKPLPNGVVLLFDKMMGPPPDPYKYWRIPDLITPLNQDGSFNLRVADGTFYIMVAQKNPDGEIGPPTGSEYLYFHGDAKGEALPLKVSAGANVDLGVLGGVFLFTPEMIQRGKGITAIEGVVSDLAGKPVTGVVVFAYLSPDATGRPVFVSDRTGPKGTFLLRVHDSSTYYLRVRGVIGGGAPKNGEFMNVTEDFKPEQVKSIKGETVKGVVLKVKMFSRPDKAKDSSGKGPRALKQPESVKQR